MMMIVVIVMPHWPGGAEFPDEAICYWPPEEAVGPRCRSSGSKPPRPLPRMYVIVLASPPAPHQFMVSTIVAEPSHVQRHNRSTASIHGSCAKHHNTSRKPTTSSV